MVQAQLSKYDFIYDTAATVHCCKNRELLFNYVNDDTSLDTVGPYGARSVGKGSISIQTALPDKSHGSTLTLHDVLYVPHSPANLLSGSRLEEMGVFFDNETHELKCNNEVIGYAPKVQRLYPIRQYNYSSESILQTIKNDESLPVWHHRFGHLNYSDLKRHLSKLGIKFNNVGDEHCEPCAQSKARKRYNRTPQERATRPFQFVHTDLVGPITPVGFEGERYYVSFTDDYTRFTTVYTVRTKDEWLGTLQRYYNWIHTKFDLKITRIRTDYGAELRSKKATTWMDDLGIEFESAASHAQEENGVAERSQRTSTEITRSMILAGNIPDFLWPDVLLAAIHIKNRRPTRALLDGMSPYEKLKGKPPLVHHLRALGSTVYSLIAEEDRVKSARFAPRAKNGVLIGYDGKTIYRVWLPDEQKIERLKDVEIYEGDISSKTTTTFTEESVDSSNEQGREDTTTPQPKPLSRKRQRRINRKEGRDSLPRRLESLPKSLTTTTTRSGRQTSRVDLLSDPTAFLISLTGTDQSLNQWADNINKLLSNWDDEIGDELIALLSTFPPQSTPQNPHSNDRDAVDPMALLAGHIRYTGSPDLETYTSTTSIDEDEPYTYDRAINGPNSEEWIKAMIEEVGSLIENQTWELVDLASLKPPYKPLAGK